MDCQLVLFALGNPYTGDLFKRLLLGVVGGLLLDLSLLLAQRMERAPGVACVGPQKGLDFVAHVQVGPGVRLEEVVRVELQVGQRKPRFRRLLFAVQVVLTLYSFLNTGRKYLFLGEVLGIEVLHVHRDDIGTNQLLQFGRGLFQKLIVRKSRQFPGVWVPEDAFFFSLAEVFGEQGVLHFCFVFEGLRGLDFGPRETPKSLGHVGYFGQTLSNTGGVVDVFPGPALGAGAKGGLEELLVGQGSLLHQPEGRLAEPALLPRPGVLGLRDLLLVGLEVREVVARDVRDFF